MSMRTYIVALLASLTLLTACGCPQGEPYHCAQCDSSRDCPSGMVCSDVACGYTVCVFAGEDGWPSSLTGQDRERECPLSRVWEDKDRNGCFDEGAEEYTRDCR